MDLAVYLKERGDLIPQRWIDHLGSLGMPAMLLNPAALESGRGFLPLKLLGFPLNEKKTVDLGCGFELFFHQPPAPTPQHPVPPDYGCALSLYPRDAAQRLAALLLAAYLVDRCGGILYDPARGGLLDRTRSSALWEEIHALEHLVRGEQLAAKPRATPNRYISDRHSYGIFYNYNSNIQTHQSRLAAVIALAVLALLLGGIFWLSTMTL